jgi:hypothetical protein
MGQGLLEKSESSQTRDPPAARNLGLLKINLAFAGTSEIVSGEAFRRVRSRRGGRGLIGSIKPEQNACCASMTGNRA